MAKVFGLEQGMGVKPRTWCYPRQSPQVLTLGVFLHLFVYATFLNPQRAWADAV